MKNTNTTGSPARRRARTSTTLIMLAVALTLGIWTTLDAVYDGRTVVAVVLALVAIARTFPR